MSAFLIPKLNAVYFDFQNMCVACYTATLNVYVLNINNNNINEKLVRKFNPKSTPTKQEQWLGLCKN